MRGYSKLTGLPTKKFTLPVEQRSYRKYDPEKTNGNLTLTRKNQILQLLIENIAVWNIRKMLHVTERTVMAVRDENTAFIEAARKEIMQKAIQSHSQRLEKVAADILGHIEIIVQRFPLNRIERSSLPQVAIAFGTLIDKFQLLTGGATENIKHVYENKAKMLEYLLKGGQEELVKVINVGGKNGESSAGVTQ